jgi:succinate dehydrogenase / fumarate reductase, cytochrome b subunit
MMAGKSRPPLIRPEISMTEPKTPSPRERPTSPHLQIYSWQITNTLSILHRMTGVALSGFLPFLVCWLMIIGAGETEYAKWEECLKSPIVQIMLVGWLWAFCYHLCTGVRHLFWDMGYGFDKATYQSSGRIAVGVSTLLTIGLALKAYGLI